MRSYTMPRSSYERGLFPVGRSSAFSLSNLDSPRMRNEIQEATRCQHFYWEY
jgi:hypothetical protein